MNNTMEMKNKVELKDKQFVFYIGFNSDCTEEEIKNTVDNVKRFKETENVNIKYNYIINSVKKNVKSEDGEKKMVCMSHLYFKLFVRDIDNFKKYQTFFSKSKFFTHSTYKCETDEERKLLLNLKNSFLTVSHDKVNDIFFVKSNTTKNAHFYLFKKVFLENELKMNYANYAYVKKETVVS